MKSHSRYLFIRAVATAGLAALALVLAPPRAHAEVPRTGGEPWYQQATADARQRAQALFAQAFDKHQQLLRGEAMELYEQALALWDNPDIRWDLALVLDDLGQYLRAHEQLESTLRWDAALGAERLREVRDRMQALETQRLARIEAYSKEPGANITLDGQPWFRGAGRRSTLVLPGEHYIAASKPEYLSVTRSVSVKAGEQARVPLLMDEDRLIETRRWTEWKPWAVVAAGVAVAAVGAELERQAYADWHAAADELRRSCDTLTCEPTPPLSPYNRGVTENRLALGAFAAGGTAVAVGLALAWFNQPRAHRTEARAPSPIELTPILSPGRAELSALIRF
jgi:tetratricopeptide (TPR) repeat protein